VSRDSRVLGVDIGGSSVKIWLASRTQVTTRTAPLPVSRPAPGTAEFDPGRWWRIIRQEIQALTAGAGCRATDLAGLVASSMRQAFVLVGDDGELGNGILNSDRRGGAFLPRLRQIPSLYEVTGHWPAPELTLGKLLALAHAEPGRWAAARHVLFVHDWLVWRLTGSRVTEASYACAGQLAEVARRRWAADLLDGLGLGTGRLADLVEPGTRVGTVQGDWVGLPAGLPVFAGCGDTQLAAMGAGGLAESVICVVAGSSTPVQAATDRPAVDPRQRAWISTHARPGLWAAETNAGYPGTMASWLRQLTGPVKRSGRPGAGGITAVVATPHWTEHAWSTKAPMTLLGLSPSATPEDIAQAIDEAHAYAVRANIADLEEALGRAAGAVIVTGGAAEGLAPLLADVLGRPVQVCPGSHGAARAGWQLVTGTAPAPLPGTTVWPATGPAPYAAGYQRYLHAHAALRDHLPEEDQ
jgi:sugar (pentulose or hexulose) kinase